MISEATPSCCGAQRHGSHNLGIINVRPSVSLSETNGRDSLVRLRFVLCNPLPTMRYDHRLTVYDIWAGSQMCWLTTMLCALGCMRYLGWQPDLLAVSNVVCVFETQYGMSYLLVQHVAWL